MSRRHYLVSYDVSDDKRRAQLAKFLEGQGDRVQYSVFFCDLNPAELAGLRSRIATLIHNDEDQVIVLDLGPGDKALHHNLEVLGTPYEPCTRVVVV